MYKYCLKIFWIVSLLLVSCSDSVSSKQKVEKKVLPEKEVVSKPAFSAAEKIYLKKLQEKGVLKVATEEYELCYYPKPDGVISGLHYRLVKKFADDYNLKLEIKLVNEWDEFFYVDGKFPKEAYSNESYRATPDLLKQVDLYTIDLTFLPWRERLFRMIEVYPVRIMLITRVNEAIRSLKALEGKIIVSAKSTSYDDKFKEIEQELKAKFNFLYHDNTPTRFKMVADKEGDATAADSNYAMYLLPGFPKLAPSMSITPMQNLGWVTSHDNVQLASILNKYIKYLKESGEFDYLWNKDFMITYEEYLRLIE